MNTQLLYTSMPGFLSESTSRLLFHAFMQGLFESVYVLGVHIPAIISDDSVLKSFRGTSPECQTFCGISVLKLPLTGCSKVLSVKPELFFY